MTADTPTPDSWEHYRDLPHGSLFTEEVNMVLDTLVRKDAEIERLQAALVGWFAASDTWNGHAVWCDFEDDGCDCGKEALSDDR